MLRTCLLATALCLSGVAYAAQPTTIAHQARITDSAGGPVNGTVTVGFTLYRSASGGSPLWAETWPNVVASNGYVSGALGSVTPFGADLFSDGPWFLEVSVDGQALSGRTQILAVPVAMTAQGTPTSDTPPVACDSPSHYGRMYYDTGMNQFRGCDPSGWDDLGGGGNGPNIPSGGSGAVDDPGRTCLDIHQADPSAGDGLYWIDPDGDGEVIQVLCDMTRAGGGWTFGLKNWYQSGIHGQANAVGGVVDALTLEGATYKLSDDDIRDVIGPDFRFDVLSDQAGYNSQYSTGNHEYVVMEDYTGTFRFDALMQPSRTMTSMTSYRASDDAEVWSGSLACGVQGGIGASARGLNCYHVLRGPNPSGGAYCDSALGASQSGGWHHFYMSDTNSDSYLYMCNGAQHSSGHVMNHRWWFREAPIVRSSTVGTQGDPGESCKHILAQDSASEDGLYWIRPGGTGSVQEVHCDMTTDGGGWTLGVKAWYQHPAFGQAGAVGSVSDALTIQTSPYKMSDADINSIIGGTGNFDLLATQSGVNTSYSIGNLEYVIIEDYTGPFRYDISMPDSNGSTPVFTSYREADDEVMWTGRLACGPGNNIRTDTKGINCYDVLSGPNPAGGSGCTNAAWPTNISHDLSWHHVFMGDYNSDTYLYMCNGAQHSSGHTMNHLFWFRERN